MFDTHGIAAVSTRILQGNTVSIAVEHYSAQQLEQLGMPKELLPVDWEDFHQKKQDAMIVVTEEKELLQQAVLGLFPKKYVLGIGCRKGKSCMEIEQGLEEMLARLKEQENIGIKKEEIAAIASIDVKAADGVTFASANRKWSVTFDE